MPHPALEQYRQRRQDMIKAMATMGYHEEPIRFPVPAATTRLAFEPLTEANFGEVWPVLADDPSPFTDHRFRTEIALANYVGMIRYELRYARQYGAIDYLCRLSATGQFAGLVHLYSFDDNSQNFSSGLCSIGYLVAPELRGQGFASEQVSALLNAINTQAPFVHTVTCYIDADNAPSLNVATKMGFVSSGRRQTGTGYLEMENISAVGY